MKPTLTIVTVLFAFGAGFYSALAVTATDIDLLGVPYERTVVEATDNLILER